jgi:hypothetical protein
MSKRRLEMAMLNILEYQDLGEYVERIYISGKK